MLQQASFIYCFSSDVFYALDDYVYEYLLNSLKK